MIIKIDHPELGPQNSYVTTEVTATDTSTEVENTEGYTSGDYVVFGHPGEEKTEIVLLTGVTGNTTLNHTTGPVYDHPVRTPIYQIKYNQIEIYRAGSQGGAYSLIATIDITLDEDYTIYDDTAGDTSSWYKLRYKDANDSSYSGYSDEVQGIGYTTDSLRDMTNEVLEEFGDTLAKQVKRKRVKKLLQAGVRKITMALIQAQPDYRKAYTTTSLVSGTATYDLPERFLLLDRMDINFSGSVAADAFKAEYENERSGMPNQIYSTADPRVSIRGEQFVIKPTPTSSSGLAFIWYWNAPEEMENESDEHGLPYGARDTLVLYALYRLWLSKNVDKAKYYQSAFKDSLAEVLDFLAQKRGMKSFRVDVEFGYDLYDPE